MIPDVCVNIPVPNFLNCCLSESLRNGTNVNCMSIESFFFKEIAFLWASIAPRKKNLKDVQCFRIPLQSNMAIVPAINIHFWLVVWNIFIFPYIGNNDPNWLIFFRVSKTALRLCAWSCAKKLAAKQHPVTGSASLCLPLPYFGVENGTQSPIWMGQTMIHHDILKILGLTYFFDKAIWVVFFESKEHVIAPSGWCNMHQPIEEGFIDPLERLPA